MFVSIEFGVFLKPIICTLSSYNNINNNKLYKNNKRDVSNETGASNLVTYSITLCIYNGISPCKYLTRKKNYLYICASVPSFISFSQ